MNTSTDWPKNESDKSAELPPFMHHERIQEFKSPPLPEPHHLDVTVFERQERVPGHNQRKLDCHVGFAGAGGLNSWSMLGMVRAGLTAGTVGDPNYVSRTNLTRQYYFPEDLGKNKAHCLAGNLSKQSTAEARLTGIAAPFEEAFTELEEELDLIVVGVDNNRARLAAARFARERNIPAVFATLSLDGTRVYAFLQGPGEDDACWHCAVPTLDPEGGAACAAAIISSCFLAAAFLVFFSHRALMGWPEGVEPYNWRTADLLGTLPNRTGFVQQRADCPTCGEKK